MRTMMSDPYGQQRDAGQMPRANWWIRLTSSGWDKPQVTIQQREFSRRSRLTAWIILGLLVMEIVILPSGFSDFATLAAVAGALVGTIAAAVFNRFGLVSVAGSLLVLLVIVAIVSAVTGAPGGQLDTIYLPAYDLFAIAVIIGASILPRAAAFVVAGVNVGLIVADFVLQPKTGDLARLFALEGALPLIARPIALQLIVAVVAYLWVRGTDEALRRADNAEELAALEHAVAEQRRQLEVGAQQILETHVRIANGDFAARAPVMQDNILWQVAASLNNLLSRMQKSAQSEHQLRRTEDELRRLASAIDDAQSGRRPIWPAPTGTAADLILERITGRSRQMLPQGPASVQAAPPPPQFQQPAPPALMQMPPMQMPPLPANTQGQMPMSGPSNPSWVHSGQLPQQGEQGQQGQQAENPWFNPPDTQSGW